MSKLLASITGLLFAASLTAYATDEKPAADAKATTVPTASIADASQPETVKKGKKAEHKKPEEKKAEVKPEEVKK